MANDVKELSKFCNDPRYREKVIARIHKDMDKEYNRRIKALESQKNALIVSRNKEIDRISNTRWESYANNRVMVNRTEGTISINNVIYYFSSITGAQVNMIPGYRIVSTETSTTQGRKHASVGGAIVGGMIAGPVGAVVGGTTLGKNKSKTQGRVVTNQIPTCMHLGVVVNLEGFANEIVLLTQQVDQSNSVFIKAYQEAQNIVALLSSLARTPVPLTVLRPEEEQSVKLLDAQIINKQMELEAAMANVPNYALPLIYRTAEQRYMSDEEYLQYLRNADYQRTAQIQVANNQGSIPVQEKNAVVDSNVQRAYEEKLIYRTETSNQNISGVRKATSVFGKVMGWIVSSVLSLVFLISLLLLAPPQQMFVTAVAILTMLIVSIQVFLINPLLSNFIPSKAFWGWIKRHRISVAAMLGGVWFTIFTVFVFVIPVDVDSSQATSGIDEQKIESSQVYIDLDEQRIEEITLKWKKDGVVDYSDIDQFELAVNNNEELVGKIVRFTVVDVKPTSILGYNLYAGEHLNFVSDEGKDVNAGDEITIIVTGVKKILSDSYKVTYVLLDRKES